MRTVRALVVLGSLAMGVAGCASQRGPVPPEQLAPAWRLHGSRWDIALGDATISLHLDTLEAEIRRGEHTFTISRPGLPSMVGSVETNGPVLSWSLPDRGLRITAVTRDERLELRFMTNTPQEVEWPRGLTGGDDTALIVPISEGLYLPVTDDSWLEAFEEEECFSTHGGLSFPALGLAVGDLHATLIWPRALHNEVCLQSRDGRLEARAIHASRQRDGLPPHQVIIVVGEASPLAPALEFRRWLIEQGGFETLTDKAESVPAVERLFGATHAYLYGDGREIRTLGRLRALGLDRMWLGYDQDEREDHHIVDTPFIEHAIELGYLIGPYDTHNNIQDPTTADTPLSIYTRELYREGGVLTADGTRVPGFGGRGFLLSSEALRRTELFARRVDRTVSSGANSIFLDCDAFGDLVDDYDPAHPMTKSRDQQNKLARLFHLSRTRRLVTGSESAASWAVPALHFTHGPHTVHSRLWWAFMFDREVFGGYWPPGRPNIFFRQVETPELLAQTNFDPRYRVPLYQAVFHDSIVSTDRWELSPIKLADLVQVRTLIQLLYGVPPLWSVDGRTIEEQGPRMARHHRFFSPIHRAIATVSLDQLEWLTTDRRVQRTRFGSVIEMTANFRDEPFEDLPPLCLQTRWLETGRVETYCPDP